MSDFKVPPPPPSGFGFTPEAKEGMQTSAPAAPTAQAAPVTPPAPTGPVSDVNQNQGQDLADKVMKKIEKVLPENNPLRQKMESLSSDKKNMLLMGGVFMLGLIVGALFFGSSETVHVNQGLQGIVKNPDVRGERRCGTVDGLKDCVLYILNNKNSEKQAKDFYELAGLMSGRAEGKIKQANINYSLTRIPPGYFVQIKIPRYQ